MSLNSESLDLLNPDDINNPKVTATRKSFPVAIISAIELLNDKDLKLNLFNAKLHLIEIQKRITLQNQENSKIISDEEKIKKALIILNQELAKIEKEKEDLIQQNNITGLNALQQSYELLQKLIEQQQIDAAIMAEILGHLQNIHQLNQTIKRHHDLLSKTTSHANAALAQHFDSSHVFSDCSEHHKAHIINILKNNYNHHADIFPNTNKLFTNDSGIGSTAFERHAASNLHENFKDTVTNNTAHEVKAYLNSQNMHHINLEDIKESVKKIIHPYHEFQKIIKHTEKEIAHCETLKSAEIVKLENNSKRFAEINPNNSKSNFLKNMNANNSKTIKTIPGHSNR